MDVEEKKALLSSSERIIEKIWLADWKLVSECGGVWLVGWPLRFWKGRIKTKPMSGLTDLRSLITTSRTTAWCLVD